MRAGFDLDRVRILGDAGFLFDNIEYTVGCREPSLNGVVEFTQILDRLVKQQHGRQKRKKSAGRISARDNLETAVPDDQRRTQPAEEQVDGAGYQPCQGFLHLHPEEPIGFVEESFFFVTLHAEAFDNFIAGKGFVHEGADVGHGLLAAGAGSPHPTTENDDRNKGRRQHQNREGRKVPDLIEDDENQPDDGEAIAQGTGDGGGEHVLDKVYVVDDPRHQDPGGFFVEKSQVQILNGIVQAVSQPADDILPNVAHEEVAVKQGQAAQQINPDDTRRDQSEHFPVLVDEDVVQDRLDEVGGG